MVGARMTSTVLARTKHGYVFVKSKGGHCATLRWALWRGDGKKLVFYFCSPNRGLEGMGVVTRLSFFSWARI